MTGAPALPAASSPCPVPPADLHRRKIPELTFDITSAPLLRIHPTIYSALHFNRPVITGKSYRFDAPNNEYGALYASPEFDVCVAETLIRDQLLTWPFVIDESQITGRSISTLGLASGPELFLVDLTAALFPIDGTTAITSIPTYEIPNQWGKAFYEHPKEYDGLYFRSRFSNMPSIVLFDRVHVTVEETVALAADPRMEEFLNRYEIAVI
jgi:hypothetical protein